MTDAEIKALAAGMVPFVREAIAERTAELEARIVGLEKCIEELQSIVLTMAQAGGRDG